MIVAELSPQLAGFARDLYLSPQQITQTINDRDSGLLTDGLDRILALRWFDSEHGLLVDAEVTKCSPDLSGVRFHAVRVNFAAWIGRALPAGAIDPDMPLQDIMHAVAQSFGTAVSCHAQYSPRFIYSGPWDGVGVNFKGVGSGSEVFFSGTFYPDKKSCELVWAIDFRRYLAWFQLSIAASVRERFSHTPENLLLAQKSILEDLLGVRWLETSSRQNPKHPGYKRWLLCSQLLSRRVKLQIPMDIPIALQILELLADSSALIECTNGDRAGLTLGSLTNYGDTAVAKRIKRVMSDNRQFHDVLFEMICASLHMSKSHLVIPTQADGMPDLYIQIPEWKIPVFAECKRLSKEPGKNTIKGIISKANDQLKKADGQHFGVLYVDVSECISNREANGDEVPSEVSAIKAQVEVLLREFYRSVSAAVILWRDCIIVAAPTHEHHVAVFLRYRHLVIRHARPNLRLPWEDQSIRIGNTSMVRVVSDNCIDLD